MTDYTTVEADSALENDLRALVRLAIAEDLRDAVDWTTVCLIEPECKGGCQIGLAKAARHVPKKKPAHSIDLMPI